MEINELPARESIIYFPINKFKVNKISRSCNSIKLYYSKFDLKKFTNFNVVLQNIKTREEYRCNFNITNEYIAIDLDTLADYFTDYEASIFISLQKDKNVYYYIPVITSYELSDIEKKTYNNSNYQWYIRTSPNRELRLSCYKLITA